MYVVSDPEALVSYAAISLGCVGFLSRKWDGHLFVLNKDK